MLTLLDYDKTSPFSEIIGSQRNLAWPIHAYRVTLPRASADADALNPFERVVLKLLGALGAMDAEALVDETCIPLGLVKGILLRLQDKELIDEFNNVIEDERDDDARKDEKPLVFATALVFRELVTGKHLPFVHWLGENPLKKKEGQEHQFRFLPKNAAHNGTPLTQRDVISILQATQRRSRAFGKDTSIPAIGQVTIVRQPELHYLDCPIAIQKSDGEFRVADPFGNGFSLVLERALELLLEYDDDLANWLQQWKSSLRNPHTQSPRTTPKDPFETDANWQRYPKLVASLRPPHNTPFLSLAQIYASIEWALFYACSRRPFEDAVATLKFALQTEHPALLADVARELGLTLPPSGLRPVRAGKLTDFQYGKAELETLLSITLLQARRDGAHPLRRVASLHPGLVNRLDDIRRRRNAKQHGKGGADAPESELSDAPFMRDLIHALLPHIVFSGMPIAELDRDFRADSLLDARASIQGEFGFRTFNQLGTNMKERLIHAERFFLSCKDGDDALVFARELYAGLQLMFEITLSGGLPPDAEDTLLIELAGRRAASAGFCSDLPHTLRTVKVSAVRQTLQGACQSLGACAIAWLLMSDDDTLRLVADTHPSFVSDVANVVNRRGHGNEPLMLSAAQIADLRKASYKTIKTLIEV
jgi:hypothetical protein